MKELQERIQKDGIAVNEDILKVDSFINHQVDPELMEHIGEEFANHFKEQGITKIARKLRNCSCTYDRTQYGITAHYFKEAAFQSAERSPFPDGSFFVYQGDQL